MNSILQSNAYITEKSDGTKLFTSFHNFEFQLGGSICPLNLVYETYGKLAPEKDNVILVHHALSTHSHLRSHTKNQTPGWWEEMVGPNKPIDTNTYFVICINNIGSCFGSSGPASINPKTTQSYRRDFPQLTIKDIARSQQLLLSYLGIEQVHAIIGNSMGAMISLTWTILFPNSIKHLISVSSYYKASPISIATHALQKEIMHSDPEWKNGYYETNPTKAFTLARKVGLLSYRHPNELNTRFIHSNLLEYLEYNSRKFTKFFDANSYLYLIDAMDMFDVTKGYENKKSAFSSIKAAVLIISIDSDLLFPHEQQYDFYQQLTQAGVSAEYKQLHSHYGHDAFYTDEEIKKTISSYLERISIEY